MGNKQTRKVSIKEEIHNEFISALNILNKEEENLFKEIDNLLSSKNKKKVMGQQIVKLFLYGRVKCAMLISITSFSSFGLSTSIIKSKNKLLKKIKIENKELLKEIKIENKELKHKLKNIFNLTTKHCDMFMIEHFKIKYSVPDILTQEYVIASINNLLQESKGGESEKKQSAMYKYKNLMVVIDIMIPIYFASWIGLESAYSKYKNEIEKLTLYKIKIIESIGGVSTGDTTLTSTGGIPLTSPGSTQLTSPGTSLTSTGSTLLTSTGSAISQNDFVAEMKKTEALLEHCEQTFTEVAREYERLRKMAISSLTPMTTLVRDICDQMKFILEE